MSKTTAKQTTAIVPATETSIVNRTPEVIAGEIRFIDQQAKQYFLQSAIEIGTKLTEAKALVGHGEWGVWLQTNVNYSQSTAINFMKVASEYANSQTLANLSYSQAVALLSVPAEDREAFVEDNNAAEMSTRELQATIKEKQELERKLAEQKEQFDKWAEGQKEQRDSLYEQYQAETNLRKSKEDKVRELEQEVEKAQKAGDAKETAKIKAELRKAEKTASESAKKLGELEASLKQKEAELEKTITDRLNEQKLELDKQASQKETAYQEQIAKLDQQLERNNNEAFLKAKLQLQIIIAQGDTLVKAIAEVKEPEEQNKLKAAAATVIDQLKQMF